MFTSYIFQQIEGSQDEEWWILDSQQAQNAIFMSFGWYNTYTLFFFIYLDFILFFPCKIASKLSYNSTIF